MTSALHTPNSHYEKKITQNEHIIAHFEYFFTCHYSKTVWLAENLNEVKITHYEKIFSHIKQKFSGFEKGLGNIMTSVSRTSPKIDLRTIFFNLKNRSFENVSSSQ